jgi:DNA-binding MarR family transcriptional regulator/N-acetylglutamate synthase-like GNAT family acetyltransferase
MPVSAKAVSLVRAFNRDFTRRIGVVREGLLDSRYSLTEVRVLYELAHRRGITAGQLATRLDLDRGYLSRLLRRFGHRQWLRRTASESDGRRQHLSLTAEGRRIFAPLERRAQAEVRRLLAPLDAAGVRSVLDAMQTIQRSFGRYTPPSKITFREHRPGDIGWVIARHGELYASEFGWTEAFEALVAHIAADFVQQRNPARERCWIAESDGKRLGCIFLVATDEQTAKLRLLLVEPAARGTGLGSHLVARCVGFARDAGYRCIELWTQRNLSAARRLYQRTGFTKVSEAPHHSFGHDLVGETWRIEL